MLLIVAVGVVAYHNSFQGPFILDDIRTVLDNPAIHHLWPIWKAISPNPLSMVAGRPVVSLSLALNYFLGGTDVRGYHAFNLGVHLLAAVTLYGIVRRTLLCPRLQERFGPAAEWIALSIAVLWSVHPLQTEAVTYVSQRCESLMGLFYLLTLYAFIRGTEAQRPFAWFALSVAACFLGMASKEVMVTAPVMVLLYDRCFVSGSFREAWHRHNRLYWGLASSWLLLGYLLIGLHNRNVGFGLGITGWGYALTESQALLQYIRLALWPHPLVLDYGEYLPPAPGAAVELSAVIVAILIIATLLALQRRPAVGFLGAWFLVTLAPSSSLVPIVGSPMAEHRMYLALAAIVAAVVIGAYEIGTRFLNQQPRMRRVLESAAAGALALVLASLTIQRNRDYRSDVAIWEDTVQQRPANARAHNSLGYALAGHGRLAEAIPQYEEAARLQPGYLQVWNDMGVALTQLGRLPEAIGAFEQALRLDPHSVSTHYNLGLALVRQGKVPEAIDQYEEALRGTPKLDDLGSYPDIHNDFGLALAQQGRNAEAVEQYEQALRINPEFAAAHFNLGLALMQQGRTAEALSHWKEAARLNPDNADAQYNLGLALMQSGQLRDAAEHFQQAVQLVPDSVEGRVNLGVVLLQLGDRACGMAQFQEALRLQPESADLRYRLGRALFQTGNIKEAVGEFEALLSHHPEAVPVRFDLGLALAKLGRTAEAVEQCQQILKQATGLSWRRRN